VLGIGCFVQMSSWFEGEDEVKRVLRQCSLCLFNVSEK
jgi:hypothetical protein